MHLRGTRALSARSQFSHMGTGIRVETESGELIGRVEEQACPDWTLTINEDGTLDYVEN